MFEEYRLFSKTVASFQANTLLITELVLGCEFLPFEGSIFRERMS
jgi:hypothetical protein